jgi:hypothetical protein
LPSPELEWDEAQQWIEEQVCDDFQTTLKKFAVDADEPNSVSA